MDAGQVTSLIGGIAGILGAITAVGTFVAARKDASRLTEKTYTEQLEKRLAECERRCELREASIAQLTSQYNDVVLRIGRMETEERNASGGRKR